MNISKKKLAYALVINLLLLALISFVLYVFQRQEELFFLKWILYLSILPIFLLLMNYKISNNVITSLILTLGFFMIQQILEESISMGYDTNTSDITYGLLYITFFMTLLYSITITFRKKLNVLETEGKSQLKKYIGINVLIMVGVTLIFFTLNYFYHLHYLEISETLRTILINKD